MPASVDELPAELRVVFTGHTGLGKSRVLQRLCQCVYEHDPNWRSLPVNGRQEYEKRLAQFYSAEKPASAPDAALDMKTYLAIDDIDARQQRWYNAISNAIEQWRAENPRFAFLSLHLSYHYRSELFSPYSWKISRRGGQSAEPLLLRLIKQRFRPHYVVTLIDDIAYVQQNIAREGFAIRLRELLTWRNVEILMSDLLANQCIHRDVYGRDAEYFPYERSPVVAIRHPPEMLFRLLFRPHVLRIYTSYPITRTRNVRRRRKEIDEFRYTLHEKFTVFDPLAVDDRVIQNPFEDELTRKKLQQKKWYSIEENERWPIEADLTSEPPSLATKIVIFFTT